MKKSEGKRRKIKCTVIDVNYSMTENMLALKIKLNENNEVRIVSLGMEDFFGISETDYEQILKKNAQEGKQIPQDLKTPHDAMRSAYYSLKNRKEPIILDIEEGQLEDESGV